MNKSTSFNEEIYFFQFLQTIRLFSWSTSRRHWIIKPVHQLHYFNDTHREKLNFIQFSTRMADWLLLTFLICLYNQLGSIMHSSITYKNSRWLKNVIHQIERKNKWLLLLANFTAKFGLVFLLTFFLERFHFKANWNFILKIVLGVFKITLRLRDQRVFIWQSVKILNVFNTLTLKQIFWKTKTCFKKLEYCFLVESTNIKNA